ncbi:MAG: hypothetical protein ISP90_05200 [Nevskia sp.]|nr:hypothetical protein [Nevskia sp.]
MSFGRTPRILLLLAFFAGQMFALAHAARHELVEQGKTPCEICAIAHASPVPAAEAVPAVQAIAHVALDVRPAPAPLDSRPFERPNTRGPPIHLA